MHGMPEGRGAPPRRRADRAGRALRGRRPQGRRLLGRHAAPARPRAGAGPRARGCCSSTSRPPGSTCRAGPRSGTRSRGSRARTGVTVFLTTQYLEEADALADRVGIIDTGKIVAEGTPDALKAEIGRPTVEAGPLEEADMERMRAVLARFGSPERADRGTSRCASTRAPASSPTSSARSTPRGSRSATSRSTRRRLDDVFLVKTGRRLEGAGDEAEQAESEHRRARGGHRRERRDRRRSPGALGARHAPAR